MYAPTSWEEQTGTGQFADSEKSSAGQQDKSKDVSSKFELAGGAGKSDQAFPTTPAADSGWAPPPAVSTKMMANRSAPSEVLSKRSDTRIEKILLVIREHEDRIFQGRLDINDWVIKKWISVKDRIAIAPDSGMEWHAKKDQGHWRIQMVPVR